MPPRRCLPSWRTGNSVGMAVEPWLGPGRGPADAPGKGLAGVFRTSLARILPGVFGRPRQGSCRGSLSSGSYLDLQAFGLHKDLHATTQAPLILGLDAVDGVRVLRLKGGGLAGVGQVAPARLLPGLCRPPRQGCCRGKPVLPLRSSCLWLECCLGSLVPSLPLPCQARPHTWL